MKIRNYNRDTMWIKGVKCPPGVVVEVPGLTLPELKGPDLRTRVVRVNIKQESSSKNSQLETKEKTKPLKTDDTSVTVVRLHDEEEPKVMGELDDDGTIKIYDRPKTIEKIKDTK